MFAFEKQEKDGGKDIFLDVIFPGLMDIDFRVVNETCRLSLTPRNPL